MGHETGINLGRLSGQTILGVNPPVLDFAWFDLWAKPAGLLNILGFLRERGNRVHLLDCLYEARTKPRSHGRWHVRREEIPRPAVYADIPRRFYSVGLGREGLRARLADRPPPDLILVTSIMTYWYLGVFDTIALLKERFPQTPVVLGGLYAALCPEHAATAGADYVATQAPLFPARPAVTPLDLYDRPDYGLVTTSHGCPNRCGYCASPLLTPRFQPRPLTEIFTDLDHQCSLGSVRDLAFYDDALLWDAENRLYPLCEHIRQKYPDLRLHTPNGLSVAQIDERCADTLRQAGFKTLRLSLEGIDPHTSAAGGHKAGQERYERAVANLRGAGYAGDDLETYLLVGLPGQRPDDVERAVAYVKSVGARPKLCEFSPIPGTRLFSEALKTTPLIATEPLWHNNTVYAAHLSGRLSPAELQRLKDLGRPEPRLVFDAQTASAASEQPEAAGSAPP